MIANQIVIDLISEHSTSEDAQSDFLCFRQGGLDRLRFPFDSEIDADAGFGRCPLVMVAMANTADGIKRARKLVYSGLTFSYDIPVERRLDAFRLRSLSADLLQ